MTEHPLVSIFTCVYNRRDKIHRVFESLSSLTYRNIEHVVVDDGSTDGIMPVLESYKKSAPYPVILIHKENGGKHTATNAAWDACSGEFIIQLDSDDMLLPHSIEHLVKLWYEIPEEKRDEYWCVQGRCCSQFSDEMLGERNPENINEMPKEEALASSTGERVGLMKASILKEYRYPEPAGVKFVKEAVVWQPINKRYRIRFSDEVVLRYFLNEGESLSRQKMTRQGITNKAWSCRYQAEVRKEYNTKGLKALSAYCILYPHANKLFRENTGYFTGSGFTSSLIQALLFLPSVLLYLPVELFLVKKTEL